MIRRLQAEHLPLAEIRRRLETLDDGEIRELVDAGEPAPPTDTALEYLRTVLAGPPASGLVRVPPVAAPHPRPPAGRDRRAAIDVAAVRAAGTRSDSPRSSRPTLQAPADAGRPRLRPRAETAARPGDRSQWERIVLAPDIELHIRRPLPRAQNKQVDRLVTIARELLEEDRS